MKPSLLKLAMLVSVLTASTAHAETFVVVQADKKFSERSLTIKVGDTIEFVNEDTHVHNIHSATSGFEFDLGAQATGQTLSIVFDTAGKLKIRCAIHPRMKMKITVE